METITLEELNKKLEEGCYDCPKGYTEEHYDIIDDRTAVYVTYRCPYCHNVFGKVRYTHDSS